MKRPAERAVVLLSALLLAAGCAGGGGSEAGSETERIRPTQQTAQGSGTTGAAQASAVRIEQVSSGSDGLSQRQVVIAPSADALAEATGAQVPDAGEGTYLAAFWGEKPTGGYTMKVLGARREEGRIVVELALREPPPDAMVSQALTQPYVAALIPERIPEDQDFAFVTQEGRELDWPVRPFQI